MRNCRSSLHQWAAFDEINGVVGLSVQSIRERLQRARQKLTQILKTVDERNLIELHDTLIRRGQHSAKRVSVCRCRSERGPARPIKMLAHLKWNDEVQSRLR